MIGVICPSTFEYDVLHHSHIEDTGVKLIHSGMGKLRAAWACHELFSRDKAEGVLLIGFAGGLTRDLSIGDVVEPHTFIEQDYFAEPFEKFPNKVVSVHGPLVDGSVKATMLTQDRFLTENPYKDSAVGPTACDMESYAVAHFCQKSGRRYHVVKLISDVADENADHDFLKACRELSPKLNRIVKESIASMQKMIK